MFYGNVDRNYHEQITVSSIGYAPTLYMK